MRPGLGQGPDEAPLSCESSEALWGKPRSLGDSDEAGAQMQRRGLLAAEANTTGIDERILCRRNRARSKRIGRRGEGYRPRIAASSPRNTAISAAWAAIAAACRSSWVCCIWMAATVMLL